MNYPDLNIMNLNDLKDFARQCEISSTNKNKEQLIKDLKKVFRIVENRRNKYTEKKSLGYEGKEGNVIEVIDKKKNTYAMKKFRSGKSGSRLEYEAHLLEIAGNSGISPHLIDYSRSQHWIVMEKMDENLFDILKRNNGKLSTIIQNQMINIFKKLDKIRIFHADPNPLNFMFKNGKMFIIDFGFAKSFDESSVRELNTSIPNMEYMPLGFLLKIKPFCDPKNFEVLLSYIPSKKLKDAGII